MPPKSQAQSAPVAPPASSAAPQEGQSSEDTSVKALLAQTITQVEAVFASTANKPRLRAINVQRLKAEYLKTKYNVELKLPPRD
jgi:hypothetical protein